jgi:hypothetical protein
MERQAVTIHYRKLEDVPGAFGTLTLEAAIRMAVAKKIKGTKISDDWQLRSWSVPPSLNDNLLMNTYHDDGKSCFGDLTEFTKGELQALIQQQAGAPSVKVIQKQAPAGQEYVHAIMYWMAIGDHVLVLQHRSLTTKKLEEYFGWLLNQQTKTITSSAVILQAKFSLADVGSDVDDVSAIIVGGPNMPALTAEAADELEVEESTYKEVGEKRSWQQKAVEVLRAVMNSEADLQKLLAEIPDEASLQVSVHIGYKTNRRRKISRAPMQHALRNLPDGEITAIGRNGKRIGNDIRLSYPAHIKKIGSILDPSDVHRALLEAYNYFASNGKIDV